jgi:hypothetical protein
MAARLGQKFGGLLVVKHAEMTGNVGLERKPVQHGFAEGMNGLDLETARRFERDGEQPAGAHQLVRLGFAPLELGNPVGQLGIVEPDPLAKRAEDAVGHLRRGGLGVGQAEDR